MPPTSTATSTGALPGKSTAELGGRIAVWQSGADGLEWLDELVADGRVVDLGGDGYPRFYTAQAEHLIPRIIDGPPGARPVWASDPGDVLTEAWEGRTVIDHASADDCRPGEWLLRIEDGFCVGTNESAGKGQLHFVRREKCVES